MIENTTTEFNQKVVNTMLAFLNTEGGTLYLGLSDDGSVFGIEGNIDQEARHERAGVVKCPKRRAKMAL
ncbi:MAG: ATP-binding protein [Treponema sp.]|nr:ATP-binding protein [Treponema sp.]